MNYKKELKQDDNVDTEYHDDKYINMNQSTNCNQL